MPVEPSRPQDDWTHLDAPEAAAVAIAKMEALGRSAAEVAARRRTSISWTSVRARPCSMSGPERG
jgi:hypothetical protein